jgi:peptidoglycan/LPS O-acetylase OafA/YrhL
MIAPWHHRGANHKVNLFRFLLALSVATVHFGNPFPVGGVSGKVAVELFFVISGFFMESTLTLKYKKWRHFYLNRALRIYPMYMTVLVATICFTNNGSPVGCDFTVFWKISKLFSNLSLIGLDFLHFIPKISTQNNNSIKSDCVPSSLIVVVVAWTLSLEIMFYLLAPIVKILSSRILLGIWASSFAIKLSLFYLGKSDPWNYRFFPAELCLFLTGTFLARIKMNQTKFQNISLFMSLRNNPFVIPAISIAYFIFATRFCSYFTVLDWPVFIIGLAIIFLIALTPKYSGSSLLGELSYPIYLCHFLVISILSKFDGFQFFGPLLQYLVFVSSTVAISVLLVRIFTPLNNVRKHII